MIDEKSEFWLPASSFQKLDLLIIASVNSAAPPYSSVRTKKLSAISDLLSVVISVILLLCTQIYHYQLKFRTEKKGGAAEFTEVIFK